MQLLAQHAISAINEVIGFDVFIMAEACGMKYTKKIKKEKRRVSGSGKQ